MQTAGNIWRRVIIAAIAVVLSAPWAPPARPGHAATFTVNSTADEPDAAPGDGACASTPSGTCTLRAAIMEANALPGPDTITLPAGRFTLTILPSIADTPAEGDLDITSEMTIVGESARATTIETPRSTPSFGRVFDIAGNGVADIRGVTILGYVAGGSLATSSGGILNRGLLTLRDSVVLKSGSTVVEGGLENHGTATLENVQFSGNRAFQAGRFVSGNGGAIFNQGTLTVRNATLSGNLAGDGADVLAGSGIATLTNVTIADNPGLSQITGSSQVQVRNSIVTYGPNSSCGTFHSLGNNIDGGTSCGLGGPNDLSNTDPYLGPLADNGGPTDTHRLLGGSPAIDAGSPATCPATDQRGAARPRDGDNDGRAICDIGAFEAPSFGATFAVNSTADDADAHPGDGVCAAASGACTLRAAVQEAGAADLRRSIILPAGEYRRAGGGAHVLKGGISIVGSAAATTIVDAAGMDRVFLVDRSGDVAMSALTISGGRVEISGQYDVALGGGILNRGSLGLKNVSVRENRAISGSTADYWASGGGIVTEGRLRLEDVTLSRNVAEAVSGSSGGGLLHLSGTATLVNVTISGNSATTANSGGFSTGAISAGPGADLVNVTIADNAGAFQVYAPGARMHNTVISRAGGNNCVAVVVSLGHNVENGDTCGFTQPGDLSNADPRLGPLADNGGPTQTHALLEGSPAIDAGRDDGCPTHDQRGVPRPRDGNGDGHSVCDIGAVEVPDRGAPLPAPICAARPSVGVAAVPNGDGRLRVTVTAASTNNALRTLRFGRTANALVELPGQAPRAGPFDVELPPGTTSTQFFVRRTPSPGGATATVELAVVDGCGEWPTFVGGGPSAF